jgi:CHAT domain-containing protein
MPQISYSLLLLLSIAFDPFVPVDAHTNTISLYKLIPNQELIPNQIISHAKQLVIIAPTQVVQWESLFYQANLLYDKKDYRNALYFYNLLKNKSQEMNYPGGEVIALTGIARSALEQQNYHLAFQSAQEAQRILITSHLQNPSQFNKLLELQGQIAEAQGNQEEALSYYLPALYWHENQWRIYQAIDLWRYRWSKEASPLYDRVTRLLLKQNPTKAFEIAELDKARGLTYHMIYGPLAPLRHPEYAMWKVMRQLQAQINLSPEPSATLIATYNKQREIFQQTHPDVIQRTEILPPSITEVQQLLRQLDPEVTIVSYRFTDQTVIAFVISVEDFVAIQLEVTPSELKKAVDQFTLNSSQRQRWRNHQKLHRYLIAPLLPHLKTKRLGIIPHRHLHRIPFAALQNSNHEYLDEEYELFYLPNTSFLRLLAQNHPTVRRSHTNHDQPQILIMASPWSEGSPVTDKVIGEAKAIASLYQQHPYLHKEATATNFWRLASQSDVIHIASHGFFNESEPLWSKITLYKDSINAGHIYLHELYDRLHLPDTDLVVLSACQTNKSNSASDGDEHITISRAFLAAGARSVISSFWRADDTATSQFMTRFYQAYRHRGVSKLAAIREAQRDMRKSMSNSNEWSNFSLTGDWR